MPQHANEAAEASRNPLIQADPASTIDAVFHYLGALCQQKAQDPEIHPGEVLQLQVVWEAVRSLR